MLTDKERQHVEQFFEDFPSEDLFALALIISKRNLCPTSRKGRLCVTNVNLLTEL